MQSSRTFKETEYVAVIDAIAPGHPVSIVENPQQKDDDINYSGTAHAVRILSEAKDWLGSYGKLNSKDIKRNIEESTTRYPLVVSTADLIQSKEIFSEVGGNQFEMPYRDHEEAMIFYSLRV